jgi:hypothetical protein
MAAIIYWQAKEISQIVKGHYSEEAGSDLYFAATNVEKHKIDHLLFPWRAKVAASKTSQSFIRYRLLLSWSK